MTFDVPLHERVLSRLLSARAAELGDKPFLLWGDESYSFAQAEQLSNRLANGLAALGVRRGDHVALLLDNGPEIVWSYFALAKLGAVAVPLNTAAKGDLLAYYVSHADTSALIADDRLADRVSGVERVVLLSEVRGLLLGGDPTPVDAGASFSDPFCLLFTGGTTGPSKAVVWSHAVAVDYAVTRANALGYRRDDVLYTCLPLFHGNALFGACVPAVVIGCTAAVSPRFSASRFWAEATRLGATVFNSLGAMTNILWAAEPGLYERAHRVRLVTMVPMPEFALGFEARFGVRATSVYALSDFGLATVLGPDEPDGKRGTAGRARPGVEVAVLDEDDVAVPVGEVGQICLRSASPWVAAAGYYKMPEETLRANRNHWFHTGDRGRLDADGYLSFVDREKDAIRRRGENISAWEVEQIVQRHPAVAEAAAYPVRSELSEDEVAVSVVLRAGGVLDPAALIEFCSEHMAHFMVPRFVSVAAELPKTSAQKVEKFVLRERAESAAGRAALWDRDAPGP